MISPEKVGLIAEDDGCVYFEGNPLKLAPKEGAVLHLLIRSWPAAISKASFAELVWKGAMSDESLVRCIAQARQALCEVKQIKIAALYGKGYQLQIVNPDAIKQTTDNIHNRLMQAANAPPQIAETIVHGRHLIHQRTTSGLQIAETLLRKVIKDNPQYIPAKMAFAECISTQVSCGWGLRVDNILESLQILEEVPFDKRKGSGYHSSKAHLLDCAWEFDSAVENHRLALEFDNTDAATYFHYAWHLVARNEIDKAIGSLEQARALAPFSYAISIMLARVLTMARQPDEGYSLIKSTMQNHPDTPAVYVYYLAYKAYISPSSDLGDELLRLTPRDMAWSFAPSSVFYGLARCGKRNKALALLRSHAHDNPSMKATFTSGMIELGMEKEALMRVEAAAQLGCGFLPVSLRAPENEALTKLPEFNLINRMVFSRV